MREGPLVAIVDDDKSIRNATQDLLKAAGFSTATFEDAESFLGSASRASAACVVADMRMPGMTGLELYQELVASGHGIPTVIITAHPEELTQARAREAGITCYSSSRSHRTSFSSVYAKRSRSRKRPRYTKVLGGYTARQSPNATAQYKVYLVAMARRSARANFAP